MKEYEITTVTDRGQVTIPQDFRKKEHITGGDKVIVKYVDGYIVMKKITNKMLKDFFSTMNEVGKHVKMDDIRSERLKSERRHLEKTKNW